MEPVCNINHNIALILNTEEININRRRFYLGETWIDRVPTPPLSVFEFNKPSTKNEAIVMIATGRSIISTIDYALQLNLSVPVPNNILFQVSFFGVPITNKSYSAVS